MGTPSDRRREATGNAALGDSTCCARTPRQFAGERRKTRAATYSDFIRAVLRAGGGSTASPTRNNTSVAKAMYPVAGCSGV